MYIDSHIHLWKLDRGDYHWLKPASVPLYRDFLPRDLQPELQEHQVQSVIAVQAAGTVAETEFLLELSDRYEWIAGVVGWMDLFDGRFEQTFLRLRRHPRFVGIRLDQNVFGKCEHEVPALVKEHLSILAEAHFPVDLLVRPASLPVVEACLSSVPDLKAVINHLGAPPYKTGEDAPWCEAMERLAVNVNTFVKWSGIITQVDGVDSDRVGQYASKTAQWFGHERILFGSDWPVALQAGGYGDVVRLFERLFPSMWTEEQKRDVRRNNAVRFYGLAGA